MLIWFAQFLASSREGYIIAIVAKASANTHVGAITVALATLDRVDSKGLAVRGSIM
ncbi:MAG: hypothetical protein WCG42_06055 [Parachlamydiaceae bacterium]